MTRTKYLGTFLVSGSPEAEPVTGILLELLQVQRVIGKLEGSPRGDVVRI